MTQTLKMPAESSASNARVENLRTIPLFTEMPEPVLRRIAEGIVEVHIAKGKQVFVKGDVGNAMYFVLSGHLRVDDGDRTLSHLGSRDLFGEMALFESLPRSATVTATKACVLYRLDQAIFHRLIAEQPAIAQGIIQVLSSRLRARMQDMRDDYEYIRQVDKVTSAAAQVEGGIYEPEHLDDVAARTDALGQLARVFQRMVRQVNTREQALQQTIVELRIEIDETKTANQVAEITDTEFFQDLAQRAAQMRANKQAKRTRPQQQDRG